MPHKKRLLLVGWDSADWKIIRPLLDEGQLPALQKIIGNGIEGNLTTIEPQLSPMLWTSIASGKHAYHHGVYGFTEVDPVSGQVVPVSAATRQCKTIWEMLDEHDLKSHIVSWFATQGEQNLNGKMVSNMFGHIGDVSQDQDPAEWPEPMPGTYWPESLAESMNELRVSPHEIDGNEIIRLFVPNAHKVDQSRDKRLSELAKRLAESYSVHSAATHLMESDPDWDFMAIYYRAIDEISHDFMHYHPPKMEGIPEEDFEMYKDVVNSTYRAHDMMLQRLLDLAGPDTTVMLVSDHGFHSDHLRPKFTPRVPAGITVWHRPQGVIAASGPDIKKDETIYGARLLDITPTILTYFDLPVGNDMEGRVLSEAFENTPKIKRIPTWEDGKRHRRGSLSTADSQALLDQFAALGYIDPISKDSSQAADDTNRENKWNLARACMDGGRFEQALPLLEDIHSSLPERLDYAQLLGRCQLQLGLLDEADQTIEEALKGFNRTESAHILKATIANEKKDYDEALRLLETVKDLNPEEPHLLQLLAQSYIALRKWDLAEVTARKVLSIDPHSPEAFTTLARIQLHQGKAEEAVNSALEVIGFQFGNPKGHYLLGTALCQLGDWPGAETALRNAIKLDPKMIRALRFLSRVYNKLGMPDKAKACEFQTRTIQTKLKVDGIKHAKRLRFEAEKRAQERQINQKAKQEAKERIEAEEAARPSMEFTIVSGLPRSGTSLMMQILRAGGIDLMHDGERKADEDNPEGYWEWEAIKQLGKNPRILEQAEGKAIKVISALLPQLPPKHQYNIIFMRRPVNEVVDSQWKMLDHRGETPKSEKNHLIKTQEQHVEQILTNLRRRNNVNLIEVDFPSLIKSPELNIESLRKFLGNDLGSDTATLSSVVRPELYRNRQLGNNS